MELLTPKFEGKLMPQEKPRSRIDAFSGDAGDPFLDREFPVEDRKTLPVREFSFEPGEE